LLLAFILVSPTAVAMLAYHEVCIIRTSVRWPTPGFSTSSTPWWESRAGAAAGA